jgi:hypothetical protein
MRARRLGGLRGDVPWSAGGCAWSGGPESGCCGEDPACCCCQLLVAAYKAFRGSMVTSTYSRLSEAMSTGKAGPYRC